MFRPLSLLATVAVVFALLAAVDASPQLMKQLVHKYQTNTRQRLPNHGPCTGKKLVVRQEWSDLSKKTRLDYIKAVKCLHKKPSKIDSSKAPGARSRFDDFQALHIMETRKVHATGLFFPWHRHLVQLYETALREECGYDGYQPYWDWARYLDHPTSANPLYDGSATSMSGNGRYIPDRNGTLQPYPIPQSDPPAIYTPPGTGGGFVKEGPFKDWQLHLGPYYHQIVKNGQHVNANPQSDGLGYNPRRLIRDFNSTLLQNASYPLVTNMLVNMTDIHTFQNFFFAVPHLAGHSFISGYDNDLFTSPGDPLFWFHHAQVDRIWSIWQALDLKNREYALDGTLTFLNMPESRNVTLNDTMPFEFSPDVSVGSAMSPTKHGYCYIYE